DAARRVQAGRPEPADARLAARARRSVRGDRPQAHDAPERPARLGVVRDHRRGLARRARAARGEARGPMRCGVELASIRAQPRDDAEQVTQAPRGGPLSVAERSDGWAKVSTSYGYPGC